MAQLNNKDFCKSRGAKVKAQRIEKGLSRLKLAEQLGVSQQQVSHYEEGRHRMSLPTFAKIATILEWREIDVIDVIFGDDVLAEPPAHSRLLLEASKSLCEVGKKNKKHLEAICRLIHSLAKE
jgi:transcriptional regulator with XRE-family HTH domain